ncbi:hypothetical protein NDU88_003990 [Pleurodeles waltl]|uniref:Uncharacterized protein n=1 Tax=Pleurodeles waltl TaxID=8319 RepID=A0AAV7MAC9_PLEWA|nr:hypothetical protein NDU88_003990 [Pleurodeles waltl]
MAHLECPSALEDILDAVLLAIDNTWTSLESKIDMVSSDLGLLHADHGKLADRVTLVEQTVMTLPPRMDNLDTALKELMDRVRMLEQRAEDAEGRSRRNNVRLVGLTEGAKGPKPMQYIKTWLCTILPLDTSPVFSPLSKYIKYRTGVPLPATNSAMIPSLPR